MVCLYYISYRADQSVMEIFWVLKFDGYDEKFTRLGRIEIKFLKLQHRFKRSVNLVQKLLTIKKEGVLFELLFMDVRVFV